MIDYKNIRRTRNCVVWTRVSTKYQEDNGGSLKSQRECCEEYAKQHGYTIVKYCGEKHESAKTPGAMVKEMNGYVKKHKEVGTILVSEFDRFSRTSQESTRHIIHNEMCYQAPVVCLIHLYNKNIPYLYIQKKATSFRVITHDRDAWRLFLDALQR